MNKIIKYLVFGQVLIISSLFAQGNSSASIEIRLKVVKHVSVEISEIDGKSNINSENAPISSKTVTNREILVNVSNNEPIEKNRDSNLRNVSIFNDGLLLGEITSQEQILVEKSLKSNNLQLLYSSNPLENSSILEPKITIVY